MNGQEREERLNDLAQRAEESARRAHQATQDVLDEVRFVEGLPDRRRRSVNHRPERREVPSG